MVCRGDKGETGWIVAVPYREGDMQVKPDYKGRGSAICIVFFSKRFDHHEEHDRDHRDCRHLIDYTIEFG